MSEMVRDTLDVAREAPQPRSFSRPYWEATREKKILIQYDPKVGRYQFFPRPASIYTGSRAMEWREVSGKGEVFSYTLARRGRGPFQGKEPYLVATVTLDVGVNVIANLVHVAMDEVRIGMKVKPFWAPLPNGMNLLMFEPDR
ncbi:MAG TPA: OB-fold domain-containing protein [Hyphomicrobiales bacterium]|nr:OB-fold domain-containing protein [Hyphomicrobiales bacterium]